MTRQETFTVGLLYRRSFRNILKSRPDLEWLEVRYFTYSIFQVGGPGLVIDILRSLCEDGRND